MSFYVVARMADDIADHATASAGEKLRRLDAIERTLDGREEIPEAAMLRDILRERG